VHTILSQGTTALVGPDRDVLEHLPLYHVEQRHLARVPLGSAGGSVEAGGQEL